MANLVLYELAGKDPQIRFSPYCWKIRMALRHKGLCFHRIAWRFVEKEVAAQVPLLLCDDEPVSDSWQIALFLEQRFATRPSLFGTAGNIPWTAFINAWADSRLVPALQGIILMDIYRLLDEDNQRYFRATRERRLGRTLEEATANPVQALADLQQTLEPLRCILAKTPFLLGDNPTYADYCVFGHLMWAHCVSAVELLSGDDPVYPWRERLMNLFDGEARHALRATIVGSEPVPGQGGRTTI